MLETPEEVAKESPAMVTPAAYTKPQYPWGLCITLNESSLDKLDLENMPEPGELIHGQFMAKVVACRQSATDEKSSRSIELQIVALALEDEDEEGSTTKKMYDHEDY